VRLRKCHLRPDRPDLHRDLAGGPVFPGDNASYNGGRAIGHPTG
jgi:hypothetical protein